MRAKAVSYLTNVIEILFILLPEHTKEDKRERKELQAELRAFLKAFAKKA